MASVVSLPGTPVPGARPAAVSVLSSPDVSASAARPAPARGMQLGAHKAPAAALAAQLAAEDAASEVPGGWGDAAGDLMDVHADEGDWTDFETAPVPGARPGASRLATDFGFGDPAPIDDGPCAAWRHGGRTADLGCVRSERRVGRAGGYIRAADCDRPVGARARADVLRGRPAAREARAEESGHEEASGARARASAAGGVARPRARVVAGAVTRAVARTSDARERDVEGGEGGGDGEEEGGAQAGSWFLLLGQDGGSANWTSWRSGSHS
jgi:hypothetical protein